MLDSKRSSALDEGFASTFPHFWKFVGITEQFRFRTLDTYFDTDDASIIADPTWKFQGEGTFNLWIEF